MGVFSTKGDHGGRIGAGVQLVVAAGSKTVTMFQASGLVVEDKADCSPVTVVDRQVEAFLRDRVKSVYPEDGFLGEEFPEKSSQNGYRWIVDPIDGTQSFICGVPLYGTMIGLEKDGKIIAGYIYMPILGELIFGHSGHGAYYGNNIFSADGLEDIAWQIARSSTTEDIRQARFCTTSPDYFRIDGHLSLFWRLQEVCKLTRGWGDCYAFLLLATGRVDLVVEPAIKAWDIAAAIPILMEAGCCVSSLSGGDPMRDESVVAANPGLHRQVAHFLDQGRTK